MSMEESSCFRKMSLKWQYFRKSSAGLGRLPYVPVLIHLLVVLFFFFNINCFINIKCDGCFAFVLVCTAAASTLPVGLSLQAAAIEIRMKMGLLSGEAGCLVYSQPSRTPGLGR